jgi:hypothetical protein
MMALANNTNFGAKMTNVVVVLVAVSSIYIWSKNFSHSVNEKSEAKMAAIDVQ